MIHLPAVLAYRIAAWLQGTDPKHTIELHTHVRHGLLYLVCEVFGPEGTVDRVEIPEVPR